MKARTVADRLLKAIEKFGGDIVVSSSDDGIDVVKPDPGCRASGRVVMTIRT